MTPKQKTGILEILSLLDYRKGIGHTEEIKV